MLIYGRVPREVAYLDTVWATLVGAYMDEGIPLAEAITEAGKNILDLTSMKDYGTWNALFLNHFGVAQLDQIWFMGKNGDLVRASGCEAIVEKVKVMGVGEALADSDLGAYEADDVT